LQKEDLWHYDNDRQTRALADKLTANIEKRRNDGKTKRILLHALNDTFFWTFWTAGCLKVSLTLLVDGSYSVTLPVHVRHSS
jgi:hypothetical protein